MTKVKFLIEKAEGNLPCNVFAYFTELPGNNEPDMFTCYAHIAQHSSCHSDYAKECKEAAFYVYWDLLEELIGQGYNDLQIMNEQEFEYHRKPTKGEIKFGEGATHYRDFTLSETGISKKGYLKQWFMAKDDGLRYYRM